MSSGEPLPRQGALQVPSGDTDVALLCLDLPPGHIWTIVENFWKEVKNVKSSPRPLCLSNVMFTFSFSPSSLGLVRLDWLCQNKLGNVDTEKLKVHRGSQARGRGFSLQVEWHCGTADRL